MALEDLGERRCAFFVRFYAVHRCVYSVGLQEHLVYDSIFTNLQYQRRSSFPVVSLF
jgi:hypothetical protein